MKTKGVRVVKPTEFLDIAPTLADLAGLPTHGDFEGVSLTGLMQDPDSPFKPFAISQFARSSGAQNNLMGYAFRSERYRLILWIEMDFKGGDRSGKVVATELYDYKMDPLESINLASSPDHESLVNRLMTKASKFAKEHMEISWNL